MGPVLLARRQPDHGAKGGNCSTLKKEFCLFNRFLDISPIYGRYKVHVDRDKYLM